MFLCISAKSLIYDQTPFLIHFTNLHNMRLSGLKSHCSVLSPDKNRLLCKKTTSSLSNLCRQNGDDTSAFVTFFYRIRYRYYTIYLSRYLLILLSNCNLIFFKTNNKKIMLSILFRDTTHSPSPFLLFRSVIKFLFKFYLIANTPRTS